MQVVVGSENPVKVAAVREGFRRVFPTTKCSVVGIAASSGVPDQPMGRDETLRGATNRADAAAKTVPDADFWVGIEGGLEDDGAEIQGFAWTVVRAKNGEYGRGCSITYVLPKALADRVRAGEELGTAASEHFGVEDLKHKQGTVGMLTGGLITRARYYADAVVFALTPFRDGAPNV